MSNAIEFFIGISNGYETIDTIRVRLTQELPRDGVSALVDFLNANTTQLVEDINAGEKGSDAYTRVAQKQLELAALFPSDIVVLDRNYQEYGVDVHNENLGIPTPLDAPKLVVTFFTPLHTRTIYPNQFETDLYDYVVWSLLPLCHFAFYDATLPLLKKVASKKAKNPASKTVDKSGVKNSG